MGRHVSSERRRSLRGALVAALAGIAVLMCVAGFSAYQIVQRTNVSAPVPASHARLREAPVREAARTPDPAVRTPAPSVLEPGRPTATPPPATRTPRPAVPAPPTA